MTCPNCLTATTLLYLPLSLPLSLLLLLKSLSPGGAIVSPVPLPVPVPGRIFNVRLWLQNVFHSIFYVLAPRQPQKAHSAAPPSPLLRQPCCMKMYCRGVWEKKGLRAKLLCQWPKVCFPLPLSLSLSLSIYCSLSSSLSLSLTSVCLFLLWQQPKRKVRCTRLAFAFFRSIFFTAAQRGVWATWRETNRPTANGFWQRCLWPMPMLIRWPGTSSTHTHAHTYI